MLAAHPELVPPDADQLLEHHLRALVRISAAVAGAHDFESVLELAADAAREALGFTSLSLSRFELEAGRLRTLITSEDDCPPEERHPADECYDLAEFRLVQRMLDEGTPHVSCVDDPDGDPAEVRVLRSFAWESSAAVPVVCDGRVWGELYVGTAAGRPRVTLSDIAFLQAVCSQISLALSRAELFSKVALAAYEDPLTGLANRRAFEDRLEAAVDVARREGTPLTLVLGDLDGLKQLNDAEGHEVGDAALAAVGRALHGVAGPDVLAARIGGDEFGLVLPGRSASAGEQLAAKLSAVLADGERPIRVSWGVAALTPGMEGRHDLLRVADHAQYAAKRSGGRRGSEGRSGAQRVVSVPARSEAGLAEVCLAALDAMPDAAPEHRLVRVARELAESVDAAHWIVLRCEAESRALVQVAALERRALARRPDLGTYEGLLADRLLQPGAMLAHFPTGSCVIASARRGDGADGLMLFADARTAPMERIVHLARLLLHAV